MHSTQRQHTETIHKDTPHCSSSQSHLCPTLQRPYMLILLSIPFPVGGPRFGPHCSGTLEKILHPCLFVCEKCRIVALANLNRRHMPTHSWAQMASLQQSRRGRGTAWRYANLRVKHKHSLVGTNCADAYAVLKDNRPVTDAKCYCWPACITVCVTCTFACFLSLLMYYYSSEYSSCLAQG